MAGSAYASEHHGQVTLSGIPVPGVTVTASQGEKHVAAVTDPQGVYSFPDLADGTWSFEVQMTGFAPIKQDVAVAPNGPADKWELKLQTIDQIRAEAKPQVEVAPVATAAPAAAIAAVVPDAPQPNKPAASGKNASTTKTAAKPGAQPNTADNAAPPPPPSAPDAADGLLVNGSMNNAASSVYSQSPAFGNTRSGGRGLYTGGLAAVIDNSALDANSYSLSGAPTPKPPYNNITLQASLFGPIRIPHIIPRGPNFNVTYSWVRNTSPQPFSGRVPTAEQEAGNFTDTMNALGQPVTIYNPATGLPFTGNVMPLSPQAVGNSQLKGLLRFYPAPNVANNSQFNYQTTTVTSTHQDQLRIGMDKSLGKNQLSGTFVLQTSRGSSNNIFGWTDKTNSENISTSVNWSRRFRQRWFLNTGYSFSRSSNRRTPYWQNRENVSGDAGIVGNLQDPNDWGPPSLNFQSSGIASLSDGNSSFNRSETNGITVSLNWNHGRHNASIGGGFRRQESNLLQQSNPRGSFTFNGAATSNGATDSTTAGYDFADFLLGTPDTSAIAYGNADKYLRQSVYNLYIDDDWRVRPELTIRAGFRWEYGAPITELHGRLVNLDIAQGFTGVAPVLGSNPVGPLTGMHYPTSLIHPDKLGLGPSVGLSWRPISGSSVIVRAGYGITHDTNVYSSMVQQGMVQQSPLSTSLNVANSATCPLTLANGFNSCSLITNNTFAIDPHFRVGYLQTWDLSVQRDLPFSLQATARYTGYKGTRGTQQFYPNTCPAGAVSATCSFGPSGYAYRTSNGNSIRHEGWLQLRRRMRAGFLASADYYFSKSIDDDAFLGGQGPVTGTASSTSVAQNWQDLNAERSLSSFDQRHLLKTTFQYTTGMGIGGHSLMSGWRGAAYKEWTALITFNVGSGLPLTPIFPSIVTGTGATGPVRPDVVPGVHLYEGINGSFLNPAAFTAPATGQWGDARRNSITGPHTFVLNAELLRTFRLHGRYSMDVHMTASNFLNHVVYASWNTTTSTSLFGTPSGTNPMRAMTATIRLRF